MSLQHHKTERNTEGSFIWAEFIQSLMFELVICSFCWRQVTHRGFYNKIWPLLYLRWEKLSLTHGTVCRGASIVQLDFIWILFYLDVSQVDSLSLSAAASWLSYAESGSFTYPPLHTVLLLCSSLGLELVSHTPFCLHLLINATALVWSCFVLLVTSLFNWGHTHTHRTVRLKKHCWCIFERRSLIMKVVKHFCFRRLMNLNSAFIISYIPPPQWHCQGFMKWQNCG